jgi:hypothetical protein
MSITVRAYFVNGYMFNLNDAIKRIPNPIWGVHKFDPNTGRLVEQTISDMKLYNELYGRVDNLKETQACSIYNYCPKGPYNDERIVFFGDVSTVCPNTYANVDATVKGSVPGKHAKELCVILDLLIQHNIPYETGMFVVSYAS